MDESGHKHGHLSTKVSRKALIDEKYDNTLEELSTALVLHKSEQDVNKEETRRTCWHIRSLATNDQNICFVGT